MKHEGKARSEFGDFQTPSDLALAVCKLIERSGYEPASVIEPTCGRGAFLQAALETFSAAAVFFGADRNEEYVTQAKVVVSYNSANRDVRIIQGDFFDLDWPEIVADLPKPILVLGNPPWVTNSALGAIDSANVPKKSNRDNLRGIDALTGRSNFDISEWMLQRNLEWLAAGPGMLAVLCKTAVARKVLSYAWSRGFPVRSAHIRRIDAKSYFGVSVDACLLTVETEPGASCKECSDYPTLDALKPQSIFGIRDGILVADVRLYDQRHNLRGRGLSGWRSGIKHDSSKVFELVQRDEAYENGLGERVEVEPEALFPLLKSSDLVNRRPPHRWLLVPQRTMAASPEGLRHVAPMAWRYLLAHEALLAKRGSSIYRNRPRFSIFGVGDYSFAPWKVAISGLYKSLSFVAVPPFQERPVVFDDTCYLFPCRSEHECKTLEKLVWSEPAQEFWSSLIFWDAKRPITAQILNLLDLDALARTLGMESRVAATMGDRQLASFTSGAYQPLLIRDAVGAYQDEIRSSMSDKQES